MGMVGLILRLIESADGFQILVYRSLALSLMVMIIACLRRKVGASEFLRSFDRWDGVIGLLLGIAFSFYVYALLNTTIASALFILSSAPIFSAVLAWIFIGEKPGKVTYLSLALAVLGVGLMVKDGLDTGGILGNLYALVSAFCFASMLVVIRYTQKQDALGGTFLGGVVACILNAVVAFSIGSGLMIGAWDLGLSLFMGAFTIGLGIAFVTWAASYLPASEVSILVLIESVTGPIWVWLFLGEGASFNTLVGGAVVLGAVILQTLGGQQEVTNAATDNRTYDF
jgi:drug/metabolite transporter (DMT)-like permease